MSVTVKVKKGALDYFRKLARDTNKEIHAYLIGSVLSPSLVRIDHFVYPDLKEQTTCSVEPTGKAEKTIARWTVDNDLQIVGTIHSHPQWDAVLSPTDHKGHVRDCHRISGICAVYDRKTRVRFWLAESSLPAKISYL